MRSVPVLCLRALALSAALLGATVLAVPSCSLISAGDDCKAACNNLKTCGQLQTGDCGLYCTGMVYSVEMNGCGSEFDNLNACAKSTTDCTTIQTSCSTQTVAFSKCTTDYCGSHP